MKKDYRKIGAASAMTLGLVGLLGMASVQTPKDASAYFTTYVSAGGSQTVSMGAQTEIHEEIENMTKQVTVTNVSDNDCFVRVKVFYSGDLNISYQYSKEGEKKPVNPWTQSFEDDECDTWYYRPILKKGESTEGVFEIKIEKPAEDFGKDSFNVVVVQECTPVTYNEEGNPAADWNLVFDGYQGEEAGE